MRLVAQTSMNKEHDESKNKIEKARVDDLEIIKYQPESGKSMLRLM